MTSRSLLHALLFLGLLSAGCDTVATAQDRCLPTPPEYTYDLGLGSGEPCNYAVDCNSGFCLPIGGEAAVCTPYGAQTNAYCEEQMGPGFVAMTLTSCVDESQLLPLCVPAQANTTDCGDDTCCDYQQPCDANEDCCTGYCFDADEDGQGQCTGLEVDLETCPSGQVGQVTQTDPVFLCLP